MGKNTGLMIATNFLKGNKMDELEKKYYTMRIMQMTIETIDTLLKDDKHTKEYKQLLAQRRQLLLDKLLAVGAK